MAIVTYGANGVYSGELYSAMSNSLSDFIEESNKLVRGNLTDIGRRFVDTARDYRRKAAYTEVERYRDQARKQRNLVFLEDNIRVLKDLDDFIISKPQMRRWLMADPELRTLYREKRISGWDNSIEDIPYKDPKDNPDYMYIMNGVLQEDGFVEYLDLEVEMRDEVDRLSDNEKDDIIDSWDNAKSILYKDRFDPTSLWGSTF